MRVYANLGSIWLLQLAILYKFASNQQVPDYPKSQISNIARNFRTFAKIKKRLILRHNNSKKTI